MKINERGFWEQNNINHYFDESLCKGIVEYFNKKNIKSVIDIGCGAGYYTKYILQNNIYCEGYDGNPFVDEITSGVCRCLDFTKEIIFENTFDCALCLEVAEHIPKKYEDVFINNICNSVEKDIILSWAIPGQGGYGHVNEKNNDDVKDIFKLKGFSYDKQKSEFLRNLSKLSWFKNTIMIFTK